MKSVDVLVAVRNEEASIPVFVKSLQELTPDNVKVNIIFLEDGSTDKTIEVLRNLSKDNESVNYISLDNKYGQYAALTLGLLKSNSDAVITMDVDGGHPVETAVEMIRSFLNGNNLVQGHRIVYKRKKSYRSILSSIYNLIFYLFVGVNFLKQNVMFRLMDKAAKEKFLQHKNWWHIFKTNFKSDDKIKTEYVEYSAPEREMGESKYGLIRLFKLSYKSFFAMLSVKRLMIINSLLIILLFVFTNYGLILPVTLISILLVLINLSYLMIVNNYPVPNLKIIETSLKEPGK